MHVKKTRAKFSKKCIFETPYCTHCINGIFQKSRIIKTIKGLTGFLNKCMTNCDKFEKRQGENHFSKWRKGVRFFWDVSDFRDIFGTFGIYGIFFWIFDPWDFLDFSWIVGIFGIIGIFLGLLGFSRDFWDFWDFVWIFGIFLGIDGIFWDCWDFFLDFLNFSWIFRIFGILFCILWISRISFGFLGFLEISKGHL